ncbi:MULTISPECIES: DUF4262 domain-containing protein [Niastella]|uniref:DUF4262 domain-containing protein n=1 Tax=Niastella soli TaxID=2821487 RepID=A0ABS3YXY6_9BACT|nr:DUF4262 domain-containing protein [Niastella soli]MBO9202785.1 DUF4262 domain-containing protein [Niastella soli]
MNKKQDFKEIIQSNINQYGYHITVVRSGSQPRYAYTIGLRELLNFELVFAGAIYYMYEEVIHIVNNVVIALKRNENLDGKIMVGSLGRFSLMPVDLSWSRLMLLGIFDYYKNDDINVYQIIPDQYHYTLDIPDMSKEWNVSSEPVWQWLVNKWEYEVPENSTVVTNVKALLGEPITEVVRVEENEWEMFAGAGPDVDKKDMRVVSLGTILGIDSTLLPSIHLEPGKGLWRGDADFEWNDWG